MDAAQHKPDVSDKFVCSSFILLQPETITLILHMFLYWIYSELSQVFVHKSNWNVVTTIMLVDQFLLFVC